MNVTKKVIVTDYNSDWNDIFEELKIVYQSNLNGLIIDVQHVGSTSVKGLAAKPIIDIDIIIKNDNKTLQEVTEIMNELGYSFLGDMGIIGRFAFLQTKTTVPDTGRIWSDHNVYVCFEDSLGLKNHLLIRDFLRGNPEQVQRYGEIKKKLAAKYPYDIEMYINGKTPIIISILEQTNLTATEINLIKEQTKISTEWISEQKKQKLENNDFDTSILSSSIIEKYGSIKEAMGQKQLYFRISLLSKCNKTCYFCHSEGGDANMQIDYLTLISIIETAKKKGFSKIQFTGGEPLIYKHFANLCTMTNSHEDIDFGVTTNGYLLSKFQEKILSSNIRRVHISLDIETIIQNSYALPEFISIDFLKKAKELDKKINITIPLEDEFAGHIIPFLKNNRTDLFHLRIFTIMDEKHLAIQNQYQKKLEKIVINENNERNLQTINPVTLRQYLLPNGIRCKICPEQNVCCERGRSLRFGSDNVFRPCLVSREWDYKLTNYEDIDSIFDKALLNALDY